jgi:MAPEG family
LRLSLLSTNYGQPTLHWLTPVAVWSTRCRQALSQFLPLLIGIILVGNDRFLSEAIDPTLQKEDQATQINGRVVENTLQQFVMFLVGTLALSVNLTAEQMRAIPAVVIVFIVARILFWVGYRIHPLYRAFGMAATGYLNVGILALTLWKILH